MGTSTAPERTENRRDWIGKLVLPVTVSVVGALLVGALTPIGDGLRELLFPTKAIVTGSATVDGKGAADARLTLDGDPAGEADEAGEFILLEVGDGLHVLGVDADGAVEDTYEFIVARGSTEHNVGVIELSPLLRLGVAATFNIATTGAPGQPPGTTYDLTLWIDGGPDVMSKVEAVTYRPPIPPNHEPVRGGRSERKQYCYRETGHLPFGQTVSGFAAASAVVRLADEDPIELMAIVVPGVQAPINCPTRNGQTPTPQPSPEPGPEPTDGPPAPGPSPAPTSVAVPPLLCKSAGAAQAELQALRLEVQVDPNALDPPEGCAGVANVVAQQDPVEGTQVEPGTTVTIWLSKV